MKAFCPGCQFEVDIGVTHCPSCKRDLTPLAITRHYVGEARGQIKGLWHRAWGGEDQVGLVECPRCKKPTSWSKPQCTHCDQALDIASMLKHTTRPIMQKVLPLPELTAKNLVNAPAFALHLHAQEDPLSSFLLKQFSSETNKLIRAYQARSELDPSIGNRIASELNRIISDEPLFTPKRFAGIVLSEATQNIILENPTGDALRRLNFRLLCEAFPHAFLEIDQKASRRTYLVGSIIAFVIAFVIFENRYQPPTLLPQVLPQNQFDVIIGAAVAFYSFILKILFPVLLPIGIIIAFGILLLRFILPRAIARNFIKTVPLSMRFSLVLNAVTLVILLASLLTTSWASRVWIFVLILVVIYFGFYLFKEYLYPAWEMVDKSLSGSKSPFRGGDDDNESPFGPAQQGRSVRKL